MVLMTSLAMALAAPEAITLGEALTLPPAEAGDRIIGERPHGQIIAIKPLPRRGMDPPGMLQVRLVGLGSEVSDGCVRQLWITTFTHGPDQPLRALASLKSPAVLRRTSIIICRDETRSALCTTDSRLRSELATLTPWMITNQNGPVELWLGVPGQVITIVTLSKASGKIASVRRAIPAPF